MTRQEAEQLALPMSTRAYTVSVRYFEVSAKSGNGVTETFMELAGQMLQYQYDRAGDGAREKPLSKLDRAYI